MITLIANHGQNRPHPTRNSPPSNCVRPLPSRPRSDSPPGPADPDPADPDPADPGSADPDGPGSSGGNSAAAASSRPMAATVNPWSSLTNTSGTAQPIAAAGRRRTSADSENASSGTARATSWKSK